MNKFITLTTLLILVSCSAGGDRTGYEIFPDMIHAVPLEAFSEDWSEGKRKGMMLPPENAIARGKMPLDFKEGNIEAERAGLELENPYEETKLTLARGKEVYTNYCLVCHGIKGKGDGPIVPKFPEPPSLTSRRLKKYPIGRIFHVITFGTGDMASHKEQITEEDRWYLSQYVKSLQKKKRRKKKK